MKRFKKISLAVALLAALTACKNKTEQQQNTEETAVTETQKENKTADWLGVYKGTLPCADCQGIETTLTLNGDNTFELRSLYLGEDEKPFVEKGSYTWDEATSEITLSDEDEAHPTKYKVENGTLTLLNADGEKNTGELADKYVLKKVEAH